MPGILIDQNSSAGRELQERAQRVGAIIAIATGVFSSQVGSMASQNLIPSPEEMQRLADAALVAGSIFVRRAQEFNERTMKPTADAKVVELEG